MLGMPTLYLSSSQTALQCPTAAISPSIDPKLPQLSGCHPVTVNKRNPRDIAIHEAGHAGMIWLYGDSSLIIIIDMRGDATDYANVQVSICAAANDIQCADRNEFMKFVRVRKAMACLAGPAASSKYMQLGWNASAEWFFERFKKWESDGEPADDIGKAVEHAKEQHPDRASWFEFLTVLAHWTYEAFEIPEVWNAIEALADRLEIQKTMTGRSAGRILQKASGLSSYPVSVLGGKWFERCGAESP